MSKEQSECQLWQSNENINLTEFVLAVCQRFVAAPLTKPQEYVITQVSKAPTMSLFKCSRNVWAHVFTYLDYPWKMHTSLNSQINHMGILNKTICWWSSMCTDWRLPHLSSFFMPYVSHGWGSEGILVLIPRSECEILTAPSLSDL